MELVVIIFTLWMVSVTIPSSDGMSMSSSILIISMLSGIVIVSTGSLILKLMSSKTVPSGFATSDITFETFLIVCVSSLSNKSSSLQMSSVLILLNRLPSSKMSSIKLIASVCDFSSVATSLTLSKSCFSSKNSLFVACVSVSIV